MAHVDRLPEEILEMVASQLGEFLVDLGDPSIREAEKVELAETLPVWMIPLDKLQEGAAPLRELTVDTGRWHHQVKVDGRPTVFARSRRLGQGSGWRITGAFWSEIAARVDSSIGWVDESLDGDPLVRILAVPSYHLTAFWFVEGAEDRILVVNAPTQYATLQMEHGVLSGERFLAALREYTHIEGRTG